MSELTTSDYPGFLMEIKSRIRSAQYQALRAANKELVSLYWDLGQSIHQKQEALGWGKAVVQTLANDLQFEFPGRNGFSAANLWLMRQFYIEFRDRPILEPLVREISWAKNLLILKRCKDDLQREFYLRATARFGWTKAVLQHQIDNQSYEKYLLNQTSFDQTLTPLSRISLKLTVTNSPAPNRLPSDCVSGIKNARPLMSDSLIGTTIDRRERRSAGEGHWQWIIDNGQSTTPSQFSFAIFSCTFSIEKRGLLA